MGNSIVRPRFTFAGPWARLKFGPFMAVNWQQYTRVSCGFDFLWGRVIYSLKIRSVLTLNLVAVIGKCARSTPHSLMSHNTLNLIISKQSAVSGKTCNLDGSILLDKEQNLSNTQIAPTLRWGYEC